MPRGLRRRTIALAPMHGASAYSEGSRVRPQKSALSMVTAPDVRAGAGGSTH